MQTLQFHKYQVCDCPKKRFLWHFGWVRNSLHYIECPPTRRVSNKLLKGVLGRLVCFLYTPKSIHDCHVNDLHKILPASNSNTRKWTSWERNIHTIAFSSLSVETPPSLTSEWGVVTNQSNWTLFWKTKLKDQRFKVKMMELTLLMSVTMFAMAMKAGAFLPDYWGPDTLCLHVRWVCWRLSSKDKEQGLRAVVQKMLFVSVLMNVPENVK